MLYLINIRATENGRKARDWSQATDYDWGIHYKDPSQFILNQKVRYMSVLHGDLENLRSFPTLLEYPDENMEGDCVDVTKQYLPEMIHYLGAYLGEIKYTTDDTPQTRGVKKYLQEMGVDIQ